MLERIAELVIPPAWREMWVCMDPLGHLQATSLEAAGRKQYLYHARWCAHRDRHKFDSMLAFGAALPRLRRHVAHDLRSVADRKRLPDRAACVGMRGAALGSGVLSIGSEDYAERNESYGLTTMLREHVTIFEGGGLRLPREVWAATGPGDH